MKDFAWWGGFPSQDARRALLLIADRLQPMTVADTNIGRCAMRQPPRAANILINGRIAGTWKRILRADDTVAFTAGLAAAAERYAAFIGRKLAGSTGRRTPSRKGSPQQSELRA